MINLQFCNDLVQFSRYETRVVNIGNIPLGGNFPIRVQSMTNTNTLDTKATVEQTIRMIEAGSDYVRITAPSIKEAENLAIIKKELKNRGYQVPIIADVHFNPAVAERCAQLVEKVRINPGNYMDNSNIQAYSDVEYQLELEKIHERIKPLLDICKQNGTVLRIGSNHGSLSGRIIAKYGDTPAGMVEAAMEFLKIFESEGFYNTVVSMKSSNAVVMAQACRLLVNKMRMEGMNYPQHLGVTEAGNAEEGRIKSAIGIGSILADGIGDTIRVSLTEDPEFEIPVAKKIVSHFSTWQNHKPIKQVADNLFNPFIFDKQLTKKINIIGENQASVVVADLTNSKDINKDIALLNNNVEIKPDFYFINDFENKFTDEIKVIQLYNQWIINKSENCFPLFDLNDFLATSIHCNYLNFIKINNNQFDNQLIKSLQKKENIVLVLESTNINRYADNRAFFIQLKEANFKIPVIIKNSYNLLNISDLNIAASIDFGGLLIDGFSDGIWIDNQQNSISAQQINETAFSILQAGRARISKTEFISCPGCGRTLYDLQTLTDQIKKATSHLKGLKIGIMGCIVNGPGEMADADYGFVGSGIDKITLYKGKTVVEKNIPIKQSVERLIELIKEKGDWKELL